MKTMRNPKSLLTLICAAMSLTACIAPPTESPIPSLEARATDPANKTLIVMLPGRGDRAEVFTREGFEEAGRQHGFDTIMVDAHFGYYMKRSLIPALHEDIIKPARDSGYESIWLLGVSMGGLGSLLYTTEHPDQVDGLVLLAPFLGDRDVIEEVDAAGGLASWNPEDSGVKDYEIAVWSWLQNETASDNPIPILLGYGESDRLASAYPVLIEPLGTDNIYPVEGDHNWTTWKVLWDEISQRIVSD